MATQSTSAADAQDIYEELEKYPWDKDNEFQGGLSAILGPDPSASQLYDLTLRAQCFYLSRKKSIPIDFDGYKAYLASKQPSISTISKESSSLISEATAKSNPIESPSTATTTPHQPPIDAKMSITTTPTDASSFVSPSTATGSGPQNDGAPYPTSFAQIVALIQSGAPIPGIKEYNSEPLGWEHAKPAVLPKRRKPWEKDVPEEIIQGNGPGIFGDDRDRVIEQEYPDA